VSADRGAADLTIGLHLLDSEGETKRLRKAEGVIRIRPRIWPMFNSQCSILSRRWAAANASPIGRSHQEVDVGLRVAE